MVRRLGFAVHSLVSLGRAFKLSSALAALLALVIWARADSAATSTVSVMCADRIVAIASPTDGCIWLESGGRRVFPRREGKNSAWFVFEDIGVGRADLVVQDPAFAQVRKTIEVGSGGQQNEVMPLAGVHGISLVATQSSSGAPVPVSEAFVRVLESRWLTPRSNGQAEGFATRFAVRGLKEGAPIQLPPGKYLVEVLSEGFARSFQEIDIRGQTPGTERVVLALELPSCVVGKLSGFQVGEFSRVDLFASGDEALPALGVFAYGEPIGGAAAGRNRELRRVEVRGGGVYCIPSVAPGRYVVRATGDDPLRALETLAVVPNAGSVVVVDFSR